jgi:hypothetical protein
MALPSNYWFIDGIDLCTGFKTIISKSSTDLLRFPPKKESQEYNWLDEHGIDVDLTTPKFAARTVNLICYTLCDTTEEFFENRDALIAQLMLPGAHSLKITSHNDKVYSVEYREVNSYELLTPLTIDGDTYNVHKFTLVLRELEPSIETTTSRIIDETGRYIVT